MGRSQDLYKRARKVIPGGTQLLSKRPEMFLPGLWPAYYSRAKGCEVWDLDGNRYIDMSISGVGANILGYADPDVDAAVHAAVDKGTSCSLNCPEEVELADLLCQIHPWAEKVRFARTGGESMAIAVRIARAFTGRDKIAFCGYHGWHDWYLAANLSDDNVLGDYLLPGLSPKGVPRGLCNTSFPFHYNKIEELEALVAKNKDDIAAIIIEPIRNSPPLPGFLEGIMAIAKRIGAVLIIDEISSGFRLNTGGAHLVFGITPDIAVFSKALGNGYPIGAIIGSGKIMDAAQDTFISSTMWTERIGPVAAIATIKKHKKFDVGKYLTSIGEQVQEGWRGLGAKHKLPVDVTGIAPLSHFTFDHKDPLVMKTLFVQLMLERGFLASNSFYSMYGHKQSHVTKYLDAVDEVFREISEVNRTGNVEKRLKGLPAMEGFKRLT